MKFLIYPTSSELEAALLRPTLEKKDLSQLVHSVMEEVRSTGDQALFSYTEQFDGVRLDALFVEESEFQEAEAAISVELKKAIQQAADNIRTFHQRQREETVVVETMPGVKCWRTSVAIERVGLYIPGGTAPLFSTVLMLGIPAVLAGCKEITLCTPAGKNSKIHPAILYAANLVGISRVLKLGGIQAIAAMTVGTSSVVPVYKLFGPGNQYVTAAKQYAQQVGLAIDMPAGPSEVMVVADEGARADFIAADLLSQAEHGADSQVVLVTTSERLGREVEKEVQIQLLDLGRNEVAEKALQHSSVLVVQKEEIPSIINQYAPEHLILQTEFNQELLPKIVNAGSVFIGPYTPESAGDYASGTNHTLPTNGYARAYSGVSLDSFLKKITFQEIQPHGLLSLGETIERMAEAEGLDAHKNAVTLRLRSLQPGAY